MSSVVAMYIPKPGEIIESLSLLAIAFFVLCSVAYRMKLSLTLVVVIMLLGSSIAVASDVWSAATTDLGKYGDLCRKLSHTKYSDGFFAITSYFYVGRGRLLAFAGMAIPLALLASISGARYHRIIDNESLLRNSRLTGDPHTRFGGRGGSSQ
ncbi:hypothetical protein MNBD_PLANCTO02-591 [hydrothermal vent metagenome]|uniref:Uncharacterized protein n=2 Tax=hydrothermal vent metagenome TaxID=652676 RepID=A0A3B1DVM1_9ZZZZ